MALGPMHKAEDGGAGDGPVVDVVRELGTAAAAVDAAVGEEAEVLRAQLAEARRALTERQDRVEELVAELVGSRRATEREAERARGLEEQLETLRDGGAPAEPSTATRDLEPAAVTALAAQRKLELAALRERLRSARAHTQEVQERLEAENAELRENVQALEALWAGTGPPVEPPPPAPAPASPAMDPDHLKVLSHELRTARERAAREAERAAALQERVNALEGDADPDVERLRQIAWEVRDALAVVTAEHAGRVATWQDVSGRVGSSVVSLMQGLTGGARVRADLTATLQDLHELLQAGQEVVDGASGDFGRLEAALVALRLEVKAAN